MTAEKIIDVARKYIGFKENPPNSNNVIFNTKYYGRIVSGSPYPWCCVFVWFIFDEARASNLFYGGDKTAYCPTLLNYHKTKGQSIKKDYKKGDIIFFNFNGGSNAQHVGICESFDGTCITTIDGNTAPYNEANGGAVMRRRRQKKYIVGAYRPNYKEELELTEPEIRKIIRDELSIIEKEKSELPVSPWAESFVKAVVKSGIMSPDPKDKDSIERPQSTVTRQEMAVVASKILENFN